MKYLYKLLPILFIAVLLSCDESGGGDDPTPEPATFEEKLAGTWSMSSVKIDGSDVSSDYSGFSINFDSNLNYTISNGGTTFTQTVGSWGTSSANDTGATGFLAGITNQVTLAFSNEDKTLTLSFSVDNTTFGLGGRGEGLAGNYVFVLNK